VLPGPVMLSVHDTEEGFEKSRFRHTCGHRVLPSRLGCRYNLPHGEANE
jgi:hypothetical protein